MQIVSIISPEPTSRGTAMAESDAVEPAGTTESDAGFMAVLAEALARWSETTDGEDEVATDENPVEMLDGDEELVATVAPVADGLEVNEAAGSPLDVEPELQVVDAHVEPDPAGVVTEARGAPDIDPRVTTVTEGEETLDGPSLVEGDAPEDPARPVEPAVEPADVDPDLSVEGRAEADAPTDRPPGVVGRHDDPEPMPADLSGPQPAHRVADVETAGRSASRLAPEAPVSPTAVVETEAPEPTRAATESAQTMFDAELEAQEADEDPWLQVARVVRPLRQLADGSHRIALQLRPAELGTVHLEVALEDGRLSMRAVTETVAARDAFAGSLPELRAELSRSGIDLGSLDVGEQTMDGEGDRTTGRPGVGAGDASPDGGPATDAHSSIGATHGPPSASDTGAGNGVGRLDLTL